MPDTPAGTTPHQDEQDLPGGQYDPRARAMVSASRYCEQGILIPSQGYPEGIGWQLITGQGGVRDEIKEISTWDLKDLEQGFDNHQDHHHSRTGVESLAEWHYWIEDGRWMAEDMAKGHAAPVADWLTAP